MPRFSPPVSVSSTAAYWPASPIRLRTVFGSFCTSTPLILARPVSGASRVARIRTRVVLPAPFGPSRLCTVPAGTFMSTPASALVSPKDLLMPSTSIMAPRTRRISAPGTCPASRRSPSTRRSRRLTPRSPVTQSPTGPAPPKDRRKDCDPGEQEQQEDGDVPEGGQYHHAEQDCRERSPARDAPGSAVKRLDSFTAFEALHIY